MFEYLYFNTRTIPFCILKSLSFSLYVRFAFFTVYSIIALLFHPDETVPLLPLPCFSSTWRRVFSWTVCKPFDYCNIGILKENWIELCLDRVWTWQINVPYTVNEERWTADNKHVERWRWGQSLYKSNLPQLKPDSHLTHRSTTGKCTNDKDTLEMTACPPPQSSVPEGLTENGSTDVNAQSFHRSTPGIILTHTWGSADQTKTWD